MTRRDYLATFGLASSAATVSCARGEKAVQQSASPKEDLTPPPDHEKRIQWWHEAKFGMFIHWGLYSVLGQHEWAMEVEGIPVAEYEQLAKHFKPKPNAARDWAKLAKQAGQKYMVMTTKHHEGFCNFDTKLTDYCAPKQGPGRDLVKEYVEAARAEGLRVGFYYSLMDWHHPDGARCATDEAARRRFVDYTHGLIRELMTNYGKIDVLWYDVDWPLDAAGWESEKMNEMVFELQPDIIVNNRNGLPGDFSTPEQAIACREGEPRLGNLHDHERQLGLPEGRRRLEDAEDHRPQPGHLRARRRQLSAEHRPQAGRLDSRGIGAHPDRGGQMDRKMVTLFRRAEVCGKGIAVCEFHAQGQYALHARTLLARIHGQPGRAHDESKIGTAVTFRQKRGI